MTHIDTGQDATEIRSFGYGGVYIAPVGTEPPADITEEIDTGDWLSVGHITSDGVRPTLEKSVETRDSWTADDVWARATKRMVNIAFDLMQWNNTTVRLALDNPEITEDAPDAYSFDLPDSDAHAEWALIVEIQDGECNYRLIFPRTFNQAPTSLAFIRTGPTTIPVDMKILQPATGAKGTVQTDDPNVGDIAEAAS